MVALGGPGPPPLRAAIETVRGSRCENWVWSPQGVINMHCPEKWGYVQFTSGKPGAVEYRPDPTEPARMVLHEIYYAQRSFRRRHERYAESLEELRLFKIGHESLAKPPVMEITADGFNATAMVRLPGGGRSTVTIEQNSRITVE